MWSFGQFLAAGFGGMRGGIRISLVPQQGQFTLCVCRCICSTRLCCLGCLLQGPGCCPVVHRPHRASTCAHRLCCKHGLHACSRVSALGCVALGVWLNAGWFQWGCPLHVCCLFGMKPISHAFFLLASDTAQHPRQTPCMSAAVASWLAAAPHTKGCGNRLCRAPTS